MFLSFSIQLEKNIYVGEGNQVCNMDQKKVNIYCNLIKDVFRKKIRYLVLSQKGITENQKCVARRSCMPHGGQIISEVAFYRGALTYSRLRKRHRPYAHQFWIFLSTPYSLIREYINVIQMYLLHRTCVFKALHLFFLSNFPGPTLILCPTSATEARVFDFQLHANIFESGQMPTPMKILRQAATSSKL